MAMCSTLLVCASLAVASSFRHTTSAAIGQQNVALASYSSGASIMESQSHVLFKNSIGKVRNRANSRERASTTLEERLQEGLGASFAGAEELAHSLEDTTAVASSPPKVIHQWLLGTWASNTQAFPGATVDWAHVDPNADSNFRTDTTLTPLQSALFHWQTDAVQQLVDHGANPGKLIREGLLGGPDPDVPGPDGQNGTETCTEHVVWWMFWGKDYIMNLGDEGRDMGHEIPKIMKILLTGYVKNSQWKGPLAADMAVDFIKTKLHLALSGGADVGLQNVFSICSFQRTSFRWRRGCYLMKNAYKMHIMGEQEFLAISPKECGVWLYSFMSQSGVQCDS